MKADLKSNTGRIGVAGTEIIFNRLGWIFREQPIEDYGIDAHIEIIENGKATGKLIALQIKCGDSWFQETTENEIVFRGKAKHLEYWLEHSLPVLVILYNDQEGYAYWQVVNKNTVQNTGKDWKLLIPFEHKVNEISKTQIEKFSKKLTATSDLSIAHNIVLPYSERGLKTWEKDNREYLVSQAMEDYHRVLLKLDFELEKVN